MTVQALDVPVVAPANAPRARVVDFKFTADASEYFRIWVVNILLSVVTLGIYSAWAKVRTKRYFYRSTSLDGSSFDYLADPLRILKGRLIIAAAGGVLLAAQYYSLTAYGIVVVIYLLLTPWVLVKALSFNARNSALRNIRFAFQGNVGEAYGVYMVSALVYILTLGLGVPYVNFRQHKFIAERHCYGAERFVFNRRAKDYFRVYLRALLILVPLIAAMVGCIALVATGPGKRNPALMLGIIIPFYAALLIPGAYLRANISNLLFDGLRIGPHALRCRQSTWEVLRLYVENAIALVLSLGLAYPWAKVRMARYKADRMKAVIVSSLDVIALPGKEPGAYGEAAHDLGDFDFDVG